MSSVQRSALRRAGQLLRWVASGEPDDGASTASSAVTVGGVRGARDLLQSIVGAAAGAGAAAPAEKAAPGLSSLELPSSVGTGGVNAPAGVRAVQDALHDHGDLADDAFSSEAVDPDATARVPDTALAATRAAITAFQRSVGRGRVITSGLVAPGSISHRLLMDPTLPVPMAIPFATVGSVGLRGRNMAAGVRLIQQRLAELGFLSEAHRQAERPPGEESTRVPDTRLQALVSAIRAFQAAIGASATGRVDGRVGKGDMVERMLVDPTFGTRTRINPGAANSTAGVQAGTFSDELQRIIVAIERNESGRSGLGEKPAGLRNASQTPASFGRSQLIGTSALDLLRRNAGVARLYDLGATDLANLDQIAKNVRTHFKKVSDLVPDAASEADLQAQISRYTAAQGRAFHRATGLFDEDLANMFRAAQLRRQLAQQAGSSTEDLLAGSDVAANVAALGLQADDLKAYLARPKRHGEHAAGFATRALFMSQHGQKLRNAMTDNGGIAIGRLRVFSASQLITAAAKARGITLGERARAELTALVHNEGSAKLATYLKTPAAVSQAPYVKNVMRYWTPA
jgi:peptidoglycan hydrolase-like protein with peptidoglycan-binding domain